jgi:hypothetical protein
VTFYENGGGAIYLQPVELSTELKFHNVYAPFCLFQKILIVATGTPSS